MRRRRGGPWERTHAPTHTHPTASGGDYARPSLLQMSRHHSVLLLTPHKHLTPTPSNTAEVFLQSLGDLAHRAALLQDVVTRRVTVELRPDAR